MKVAELEGALLDYWVARAEGYRDAGNGKLEYGTTRIQRVNATGDTYCILHDDKPGLGRLAGDVFFCPSTAWGQGGPIIEREGIFFEKSNYPDRGAVFAYIGDPDEMGIPQGFGQDHLIAAMRAYVASKFGEEVPDASTP